MSLTSSGTAKSTSGPPVPGRLGEGARDLGGTALVGHEGALELDRRLAPLVDAAGAQGDDADARVRARLPQREDLRLGPEGVADEDRGGQLDVGPGEVGGAVLAGVGAQGSGDQGGGEALVGEGFGE